MRIRDDMKLKYYMRGLGTGILFTLFVFVVIIIPNLKLENKINEVSTASGQTGKDGSDVASLVGKTDPSDMPTPEGGVTTPAPGEETGTPTPSPTPTQTPIPSPTPTQTPTPTPTPSPVPTQAPTPTAEPTQEPTKAPTSTPTPTQKPNPTGKPVPTGTVDESTGKVTITVAKGMLSEGVCQALQKYGVVDNWEALNSYLSRNKLTDKIQTGTFTFTKGMSYEEIGKKLTGKDHK